MLSPQVSVTSPDGANLPATSTRRRGLSYLRGLSQNRTSPAAAADPPRTSPRSYFVRSTSYNESRSLAPGPARRRSSSRPNETTRSETSQPRSEQVNPRSGNALSEDPASQNPSLSVQTRRARSATRQEEVNRPVRAAEDTLASEEMARHRTSSSKRAASTVEPPATRVNGDTSAETANTPQSNRQVSKSSTGTTGEEQSESKGQLPTIRLFPHQEVRNGRQSLNFAPVSRTLPNEAALIKVGRYSEREGIPVTNPPNPSDAPVGFKSKVVSRKHCEFSFTNGQWHVKDVSSSSGTFLNHIRLSQPNTDSRLFPVKDGDILQLGIDFRGGEEMIFRCVKIRIECNRSWQKRPNNFNKSRHAQLQSLTKDQPTGGEVSNSGECAICLGSMLPYQALFVAPCAHAWHYKCIRPMLEGKNSTYPQFQCPNCRAYADLSADVDVSVEDMDELMGEGGDDDNTHDEDVSNDPSIMSSNRATTGSNGTNHGNDADRSAETTIEMSAERESTSGGASVHQNGSLSGSGLLSRRQAAHPGSSELNSMNGSIHMPDRFDPDDTTHELGPEVTRTETPDPALLTGGEGPLTPRNNAGPFVFDGSAGRTDGRRAIASSIPESIEQGVD